MAEVLWIDAGDDWSDDDEWTGAAFYAVDGNGIVAGPFDDEGEGLWWLEKSKRVA